MRNLVTSDCLSSTKSSLHSMKSMCCVCVYLKQNSFPVISVQDRSCGDSYSHTLIRLLSFIHSLSIPPTHNNRLLLKNIFVLTCRGGLCVFGCCNVCVWLSFFLAICLCVLMELKSFWRLTLLWEEHQLVKFSSSALTLLQW